MSGAMQVFAGKIYKIGIIRYVDVPLETCRELNCEGAAVPVRGSVDGIPLRTTLFRAATARID